MTAVPATAVPTVLPDWAVRLLLVRLLGYLPEMPGAQP